MEIPVPVLVAVLGGAPLAYLLQRYFDRKQKDAATQLAVATVYGQIQEDMQKHVDALRKRLDEQRAWFEEEIERERKDCDLMMKALSKRLDLLE